MKRFAEGLLVAGALCLGNAGSISAQGTVSGTVREDGTGKPLSGVEVLVEGAKAVATTGTDGRFILAAPAGTRILLYRAIGYQPLRMRVTVPKADTLLADADLVRQAAQQLDSISVEGRMPAPRGVGVESFEERRRLGFGKFIDSTTLRRMEHRKTMDVLRGTPGIRFVYFVPLEDRARPWLYEWRLVANRAEFGDEPCWMSVYVDGVAVYRSRTGGRPPNFRNEFTSVAGWQAIEIYRSASEVPMEYGGSSEQCGAVLFWTRRPG